MGGQPPAAPSHTVPLKILLTVHQFFPQHGAGTEVLTLTVARELLARGHQVQVLTGHPATQPMADAARCDETTHEGLRVHRFHHAYTPMGGQTSKLAVGYDNHLAAAYFARILREFRPDVVHFFHLNRLGTGLIDEAARQGVPCFMTPTDFWPICPTGQLLLCNGRPCHGPSPAAGNCLQHLAQTTQGGVVGTLAAWLPTAVADGIMRLANTRWWPRRGPGAEVQALAARLGTNVARLNRLQKIAAPNRFMQNTLQRHGVAAERLALLPYGVAPGHTAPVVRSTPAPGAPLRVGFVGTLAPHKGCHVLVQAFRNLPEAQFQLSVYGSESDFPRYASALRQQAGRCTHIRFCGVFPNAEIGAVMAGLDVLVLPSLWHENTPLVLYSAQASGCPVVASALPGIAEVLQADHNGLLFAPGDAQALAQQLRRLRHEPGLLTRLSHNARPPKTSARYVDELLALWRAA